MGARLPARRRPPGRVTGNSRKGGRPNRATLRGVPVAPMKTLISAFAFALSCSGCTVVSVAGSVVSTGVSVVGTAVSTGVSVAGSAVRGAARAVTPSDPK